MLPSQDKEFAGHKITKTGHALKLAKTKATEELEEITCGTKREGRPPLHSFNADNEQRPMVTDKLATE